MDGRGSRVEVTLEKQPLMHLSKNISKEPCATPKPYTIGSKATSFQCSLLATLSTPLGRAFKSRCDRVATADFAESIRFTQSLFPPINGSV